jgi:hypothetical protein
MSRRKKPERNMKAYNTKKFTFKKYALEVKASSDV